MHEAPWLQSSSPAFRLMIATSWLAPDAWRDHQEQAIRDAFNAGPDWAEYLSLVDRHRTPALSWAALKRVSGLDIPEPTRRELHARSDACRVQALRHVAVLAGILKAFSSAEIPVIALKGPILSSELYGDVGLRQSKDIDLEISLKDLSRARACLEGLGYTLESSYFPMTPRQERHFLQQEAHIGLVDPQGSCILELHWSHYGDAPGEAARRWARSVSAVWHGYSYRAMDPVDQVLYLCSHGSKHAWFRAKWLSDLARIHAARTVDWQAALQEAQASNRERPLLIGLSLLKEVYGLPLPQLPGDPWERLPAFLIEEPLRSLKFPQEIDDFATLVRLIDVIRKSRYHRLLWQHRTRRQSLAELFYYRDDFRTFPLPDNLFWLYIPLRPFSWLWRKIRRGGSA
jgi:hypothetical protein